MVHKLKILGLALVAVFAMSAVAASMAAAQETQGVLTTDGAEVKLTGTDTIAQPSKLTYNGTENVTCHGHYDIGEKNVTKAGTEEHLPVKPGIKEFTVKPTYSGCVGHVGEATSPATITMNGCDYLLTLKTTNGVGAQYAVESHLICPSEKDVEIHVYSSESHATAVCTFTFKPQSANGLFAQNEAGKVTLGGTATKITASRTGIVCGGTNETKEATLTIHAMIEGLNAEGKATEISISEKGI
jgi:hypothetical protein